MQEGEAKDIQTRDKKAKKAVKKTNPTPTEGGDVKKTNPKKETTKAPKKELDVVKEGEPTHEPSEREISRGRDKKKVHFEPPTPKEPQQQRPPKPSQKGNLVAGPVIRKKKHVELAPGADGGSLLFGETTIEDSKQVTEDTDELLDNMKS
jgi:hypothetical protein